MKRFLFILLACCMSASLHAQSVTVTGKVLDEGGAPLVGAALRVPGTTIGVTTNVNGNFTLNVPDANARLSISYIGYVTKEVDLKGEKSITVSLAPNPGSLNEVVVVAYGTQRKGLVTGSISTVVAKDIVKNTNNDVTNTLTGRAPGVRVTQLSSQPGQFDSQIDIRGFSYTDPNDILGNSSGGPLFVVDGVVRDKSSFDHLDPNEIESVSVLKDATAAIYGLKAANGVILVTTKRGSQGPMQITFNTRVGKQFVTKFPSLSTAAQFANLYNEQQINNQISNRQQITSPRFTPAQISDYESGKLASTDFLRAILGNTATQTQQNLTITGGSDKLRYFVSGGYFSEQGLLTSKIEQGKKYNFRSVVNAELSKGLNLEVNLALNNTIQVTPQNAIWALMKNTWGIAPTQTIYSNNEPGYLSQFNNPNQTNNNPLAEIDRNKSGYVNNNNKSLTSIFSLNYAIPFVDGLSAKALFSYDNNYSFSRNFSKAFSQYIYDPTTLSQTEFVHNSPSRLSESFGQGIRNDIQLSLNYQKSFGKHRINALALYERLYNQDNGNFAQTQYALDLVDQLKAGAHSSALPDQVNSGYHQYGNISYVGRVNYDYASKYLAEFGFRNDGSSLFPQGSRFGFFPYGSVGWRLSEESFIKDNLKFVDNIKLRASIGKLGDDAVAGGDAFPLFAAGYNYPSNGSPSWGGGGSLTGSVFGGGFVKGVDVKNPQIVTWYTSTTTDIGFEASFWNGKLGIEGDVFRRDRDGLLATPLAAIPGSFGKVISSTNLNSDRTQGFEIVLSHRSKIGQVGLSVSANMSYARTQWRHFEETAASNSYENYRYKSSNRYNDVVWGYNVQGQFNTYDEIYKAPIQDGAGNRTILPGDLRYVDLNGDGLIDNRDQTVIGRGQSKPAIYFGNNIDLTWKNLDFSVLLQGATMYSVSYKDQLSRPFYFDNANPISVFNDRWHRADILDPNSPWIPGRYPSTGQRQNYKDDGTGGVNTFNNFSAAYLRIKSIELGYALPKTVLTKLHVKKIRVFANAYNLYTFTGKGLNFVDPEYTDDRLYSYSYPITMNVNFGAQVTF